MYFIFCNYALAFGDLVLERLPFPGVANSQRQQTTLLIKPTKPKPQLFHQTLTHQANIPPAQITPGPGTRQLETAPEPQSALKLFQLANPKLACPTSPIPSCGKHNEGSCPHFPLSLCLSTDPGASSCCSVWAWHASHLQVSVNIETFSFMTHFCFCKSYHIRLNLGPI